MIMLIRFLFPYILHYMFQSGKKRLPIRKKRFFLTWNNGVV